jgi:hypothetical protein
MEETRQMNDAAETEQKDSTATNVNEDAHIFFEEHIDFKPISDEKYLSSTKFLQTVSSVMHSVYADFEGCKLVPMQNGQSYLVFYFNHNNNVSDGSKIVACTAEAPGTNTVKNETLRSIRLADSFRTNGEKYYLTEDGKSSLADLLVRGNFAFHPNGKVKWDKVVFDTADSTPQYGYFSRTPQMLTSVMYIDPDRIAALIYGEGQDDSGFPKWEYTVRIVHNLQPSVVNRFGVTTGQMLCIERISREETNNLAAELGIQQVSGLDIVR